MNTALLERPRPETAYQASQNNGMVDGMATKKFTVTMPEELADEVRHVVGSGGFSAYVTGAVQRRREIEKLGELVDFLEEEYGPVTEEQMATARLERDEIRRQHEERRARLKKAGLGRVGDV